MTEELGLNEFTDDTFGLYVPSTSWPFFDEFAETLESLCEFRMMSRTAVERAIDDLPNAMKRELAELRDLEDTQGEALVDAATHDYWSDRLSRAPDHFRTFVYTGITAALFASLEGLLDAMVEAAARESDTPVEYDTKPMPNIDKRLRFLQRVCGMALTLTKEQRRQLAAIRDMRNRLVHSLGGELSEDLKRRLRELVDVAEEVDFVLDDRFVRAALLIVAGIASSLDEAFEARFGA